MAALETCVRLHTMDSRDVLRALRREGWEEVRQKGAHVQLKHLERPGLVTVPYEKRFLPTEKLRSIEKQVGVRLRE